MKRILVVAMLVAASSFVFSQTTRSSANQKRNDEQAVRQVLNEVSAALGRNDAAALDRIYADSYTLVNESGELTTKAPRLAAIKSGELKFESVRSGTVIATALTSQQLSAGFPLTLELSDPRLPKKSWVKISQIRTLSVQRLGKKLGKATPGELQDIIEGLNEIIGA